MTGRQRGHIDLLTVAVVLLAVIVVLLLFGRPYWQ
jgi:hypothetical protein